MQQRATDVRSRLVRHSLIEKIAGREPGISLYGLAPPKLATPPNELESIVARQIARLQRLDVDGLVVYDIQDEAERTADPRPFPFLPTLSPDVHAYEHLGGLALPKVVYRCVNRDTPESFVRWLGQATPGATPRINVLVGAPNRRVRRGLALSDAYALVRQHQPGLRLGGIAIAERHASHHDEHQRILAKTEQGCTFFITQAVYDVDSTKSLLSDYALALRDRGQPAVPIILTFSPCGSERTMSFMSWLGIHFPRWLQNDLKFAADPLAKSLDVCERIFLEASEYALEKGVPLGFNVESVSIRKAEIEASMELVRRLSG